MKTINELKTGTIAAHDVDQNPDEREQFIKDQEAELIYLRRRISELEGEVRGLKFALMCDGVSGGEMLSRGN